MVYLFFRAMNIWLIVHKRIFPTEVNKIDVNSCDNYCYSAFSGVNIGAQGRSEKFRGEK